MHVVYFFFFFRLDLAISRFGLVIHHPMHGVASCLQAKLMRATKGSMPVLERDLTSLSPPRSLLHVPPNACPRKSRCRSWSSHQSRRHCQPPVTKLCWQVQVRNWTSGGMLHIKRMEGRPSPWGVLGLRAPRLLLPFSSPRLSSRRQASRRAVTAKFPSISLAEIRVSNSELAMDLACVLHTPASGLQLRRRELRNHCIWRATCIASREKTNHREKIVQRVST